MIIINGFKAKIESDKVYSEKVTKAFNHNFDYDSGWKFDPVSGRSLWNSELKLKDSLKLPGSSFLINDLDLFEYIDVIALYKNNPIIKYNAFYYVLAGIIITKVERDGVVLDPKIESSSSLNDFINDEMFKDSEFSSFILIS